MIICFFANFISRFYDVTTLIETKKFYIWKWFHWFEVGTVQRRSKIIYLVQNVCQSRKRWNNKKRFFKFFLFYFCTIFTGFTKNEFTCKFGSANWEDDFFLKSFFFEKFVFLLSYSSSGGIPSSSSVNFDGTMSGKSP